MNRIAVFPNGAFQTNCYIITTDEGAALIDAPSPASRIIRRLEEENLELRWIYLTHGHFDHVMALSALRERYKDVRIAISAADASYLDPAVCRRDLSFFSMHDDKDITFPSADLLLRDGDVTDIGLTVIETPGHTEGSICLYSEKDKVLFSGDTLFASGVGRTDMPGGSWSELQSSLRRLFSIVRDGSVQVLPGHGMITTIEEERKGNPFLPQLNQ